MKCSDDSIPENSKFDVAEGIMHHIKRINLKRSSSLANWERTPLSTSIPEGQKNALFPKIALKYSSKRRAVSLNRRTHCHRFSTRDITDVDLTNLSTENDFTCAICLDILYRPRQLKCGHFFCLVCLQSYLNACLKEFSCPSCRTLINIPENGVAALPRNRELERITAELNEKKNNMVQKAQICAKCHSNLDVTECGHCFKGWCGVCQLDHLKVLRKEVELMKDTLRDSRKKIDSEKEDEEASFNKLESKIREELEVKKEELLNEAKILRRASQKRTQEISENLENTLQNIENTEEFTLEDAWIQYNKLNRILATASFSTNPKVTLDSSSLTLKTEVESKCDSQVTLKTLPHNEQERPAGLTSIDPGAVYRKKSTMCKYRWGYSSCKRPSGVAISPLTGHIYVTGSDSCKIYIFEKNGKPISSFGSRGSKEGNFLCPAGITFSLFNKELYITDKWKHCIHVFDCDGNFSRQIGKKGKGFGEFSSPEGIATDLRGNIYVADTCNDRLQILDKDGVYLREVGLISSEFLGPGRVYTRREFNEPVGVAASSDGAKIYVADSGNHRIRIYDGRTGEQLLMFGSRGRNKGQFESPESITVDERGFIVVGDSGNGRVQVFQPNGRFLRVLGSRGSKKGEFGWVSGVALSKSKEIIVTDFKHNAIAIF